MTTQQTNAAQSTDEAIETLATIALDGGGRGRLYWDDATKWLRCKTPHGIENVAQFRNSDEAGLAVVSMYSADCWDLREADAE